MKDIVRMKGLMRWRVLLASWIDLIFSAVKLWRKSPGCYGVVEGGEDALRLVIKNQPKLFLHFVFRANLPVWLNIGWGFSPLP